MIKVKVALASHFESGGERAEGMMKEAHLGLLRIFMGLVESLPISENEWVSGGSKFMAKLRFRTDARTAIEKMLELGADHHLLLARGNLLSGLGALCDLLKIEKQCI